MSKKLRERLEKRKKELKSRGGNSNMIFLKDDEELRCRILSCGEDEEFVHEVTQFYLGQDIKGVISPVSIGESCAIMEGYDELKNSDDEDDKELAKGFSPRKRYLAKVLVYEDTKGKKLNKELSGKWLLLTRGLYESIIDLYLDEEDWGDMTDVEDGYDIKFSRSGKGKMDTEYSLKPCKPTPFPDDWDGEEEYDADEELSKIIPSYEETKELLERYLGLSKDEEEDEKPKRTARKRKKKTRKSDID